MQKKNTIAILWSGFLWLSAFPRRPASAAAGKTLPNLFVSGFAHIVLVFDICVVPYYSIEIYIKLRENRKAGAGQASSCRKNKQQFLKILKI